MAVLYSNNASTTLSASITNVATSLSVAAGTGSEFPAISGGDYFYATLTNTAGAIEIIKVTARATDTMTVVRGQDGTTAVAWASGDLIELRVTKAMLDDIKTDTKGSLSSANVTTALGYTPYDATNPNNYATTSALANYLPLSGGTLTGDLQVNGSASATGGFKSRVVTIADGTSITMNADTTDLAVHSNTQAAGTLTINAPTGSPVNGQRLMLRLTCTNAQTFAWDGVFRGSTDQALPTASSGGGKEDYLGFIYTTADNRWDLIAKNFGF